MAQELLNRMEALLLKKHIPYLYKSRFEFERDVKKKIDYIKKKEKIK